MGFLSSLTGGDVGSNTLKALKTNTGLLNGFDATGNSIIDTGEQKSTDAINAGIAGYQPYADAGTKALGTYTDALGLNGDAGNAAATAAFHTSPGYDFAMDQGTTAALRGASAAGMLNSGNTLTALTKFGQGTADQEYGSWLDRLSSLQGEGLTCRRRPAGGGRATRHHVFERSRQSAEPRKHRDAGSDRNQHPDRRHSRSAGRKQEQLPGQADRWRRQSRAQARHRRIVLMVAKFTAAAAPALSIPRSIRPGSVSLPMGSRSRRNQTGHFHRLPVPADFRRLRQPRPGSSSG